MKIPICVKGVKGRREGEAWWGGVNMECEPATVIIREKGLDQRLCLPVWLACISSFYRLH